MFDILWNVKFLLDKKERAKSILYKCGKSAILGINVVKCIQVRCIEPIYAEYYIAPFDVYANPPYQKYVYFVLFLSLSLSLYHCYIHYLTELKQL